MPFHSIDTGNGGRAIVCTGRQRRKRCANCGQPADLLCDWKVKGKRSGTCDAPICATCTSKPAEGKDLCPRHAEQWAERLKVKATPR